MKRYLLFIISMVCAVTGAWAGPHDVTQDPDDATKYYIGEWDVNNKPTDYFTVADGVVTFHVAKTNPQGQPESLIDSPAWNNISNKFNGATRIKFANDCLITKKDLEKFLQGTTYYVDLFDITNGTNTPMKVDDYTTTDDDNDANNIDKIIEAAVADMVTNGWQAKGIILPLNTGSGTSKVEKATSNGGETFTEYAVYYRDTQKTAAIYAHDGNMRYSFEWVSSNTDAQNHYNTAYAHLSSHSEVANAKTFIVSTNNKMRGSDEGIDLSSTITGSDVTKISIINDEMVYLNQTGRSYLATITVDGAAAGAFAAAVANTGIKNTPCEKLIVQGPVNNADVDAVNDFTTADGPLVYSLAGATGVTQAMLPTITNNKLEYIILPYDMATEQIAASNFSSSLTNLKAAIAPSSDKTKLSAYVKVAGSLGMARYYATGGTLNNNQYAPNKTNLTDVILSGYLNASDLITKTESFSVDANGHWIDGTNNQGMIGMDQEYGIKTFDLEKAVFETQSDMNFWKAGYEKLTSVVLPTSDEMTIIPAHCLDNNALLKEICISHNYKYIEDGAFWGTGIDHITATDAAGAVIDNGPLSYTLPASLLQLGITPEPITNAISCCIFPQNMGVTDIYSLATKAPKCYKNVFPKNACNGWGGFNDKPYCRDKYYNGTNPLQSFAVLRFPSETSFDAAPANMKETITEAEKAKGLGPDAYTKMRQLYTDINKVYTKKEQTGAVDANGDPITWPTLEEIYRVYNQASLGLTWNDWEVDYTDQGIPQVIGGQPEASLVNGVYTKETVPGAGTLEGDYPFDEYAGWHQLVLSQATHVNPDEIVVEEKIVRNYVDAGSFTFCIPFDLTYSQVVRMMGVPASTDKVENYYGATKVTGEDGKVTYTGGTLIDDESKIMMPEIRQLASVIRTKGTNGGSNSVNFRLTKNLVKELTYTDSENKTHRTATAGYLNFYEDNGRWTMEKIYPGSDGEEDPICLVGGRPYIIKAYMREGETITGRNLGMYIMTHYADEFGSSASCINSSEYTEQLETFKKVQDSGEVKVDETDLVTMRFAKPYENHKVQAIDGGENSVGALNYTENDKTTRYYYTMVGQFWEQDLPLYCVYMGQNESWYRYSKDNGKNYKWNAYKCVIMASPEVTAVDDVSETDINDAMGITAAQVVPAEADPMPFKALPTNYSFNHFGGGFRNISNCYFPMNYVGTTDLIPAPMSLWFIGRDDYTFKNQSSANASARYIISIDDDEEIVDLGENVTEVKAIQMFDGVPQIYGDMKVYNLSGQYVGNSTEGLSKGIYIVGGRKVVVE